MVLVVFDCLRLTFILNKNVFLIFIEPGTAPRNVQVRPLSSSTMVIQWEEPETANGQVTVSTVVLTAHVCFFFDTKIFFYFSGV